VICAADDNEATRGSLARDLERRFGADYRVIVVDSATRGLEDLEVRRQR
jgi:hypothetical protein